MRTERDGWSRDDHQDARPAFDFDFAIVALVERSRNGLM
jgi:hypothetical protein